MEIIIIAAMAEKRVIGKNNAIPWSIKEDTARFRELTLGRPCIMGRKTWESLPKRPLPGRPNIVVSQTLAAEAAPGAEVFPSLEKAVRHCAQNCAQDCAGREKIFICGGASIYREALVLANKIELTVVHKPYEGDVFFPEIDSDQWVKTGTTDFDGFSFISYSKKD